LIKIMLLEAVELLGNTHGVWPNNRSSGP